MASRTPAPGAIVDNKYRLAERIGGGGMGHVFRAENVLAGRAVAIKFLHPELSENTELAQRFFQEAQAVNRIRHPNIVDVIDAGVGEMGPYIVMEHLEGEGVGSALQRLGRFDVDASVATCIPVLEALDAAHRVGIIHRDLKPENVFVAFDVSRGQAVVRLLDFGIAKVLDSSGPSPRTRTGVVFGTPDYLSPEQATGDAPIDGRSDLFAVGVLLYELLTGTRPFRAPTAVATAFRVVHAEAPTLAAAGVHVDPRLEAVVAKLLQKDPMKRYATAGEVARELDRFSSDPMKRSTALGRIINLHRRVAHASVAQAQGGPPPPPPATILPEPDRMNTPLREPPAVPAPIRPSVRTSFTDSGASSMPYAPTRVVPSMGSPSRSSDPGPPPRGDYIASSRNVEPLVPPAMPKPLGVARSTASSASSSSTSASSSNAGPPSRYVQPRAASRFPGMYQVRGAVLRAVDKALTEDAGPRVREQVVAQLPQRYAEDFLNDSINALVAYDLEALDAYMEIATAISLHEPSRWRALGRLAIGGELHNTVRSVLRPAPDLQIAIRRGISIWSRLFSFGAWKVGASQSGKVVLQIAEFEPASLALRLWVVGMVEETARRAASFDVRVAITAGEVGFTPELTCEIA
ncbi:serine/threonine-protein kinase [Polyangium mundeleinium]|uniref:Serine/threonine-protein kinase n=1 Tax=Polyangium mundeleinium TaxID=2995306 RepID=A0ABT5EM62_9BACT|nr:serine/threonine-protein kinase [Polyangium mundeleinium]MDC0741820.1 serine/threonine-protein kinase [Polyangium mundeleinium]